jgi:TatD DNase family protein
MDDSTFASLMELAASPNAAAVGEIGLDFYRNLSLQERQVDIFKRQLEIASTLGKPVAIHCRDAQPVLFPIVSDWATRHGRSRPDGRPLGVMHYFSGTLDEAQAYVELGFLISIHCSVTYPRSEQLRQVARSIPLSALVVETDSPYGTPQAFRGKRNEPAFVVKVIEMLSELRSEPAERIASTTTENALRLFDKVQGAWGQSRERQTA